MDRAAIEALIAGNEAFAARDPKGYRRRVIGLAAVGYGYVALLIGVLLALVWHGLHELVDDKGQGINFVLIAGIPLLLVLRALRVKLQVPIGIELTWRSAPALFELLNDLERQLQTPPFDHVLLTADFNAAVLQRPRLGLFGWYRNYLLIGMPLMKTLTVEQLGAVLAHELGHLSRGHSRGANRIYQLRRILEQLSQSFPSHSQWLGSLVQPFVKYYIPRFIATSFPLARASEYDADATSARLTDARTTAQALTAVSVFDAFLKQRYWPAIIAGAKESPQPAFAPYAGFPVDCNQALTPEDAQGWLESALRRRTSYADTHPALADRLEALKAAPQFSPPAPGQSADGLLGEQRTEWERRFDEGWRAKVAGAWKQAHEQSLRDRARLLELRAKGEAGPLPLTAEIELARVEEAVGDRAAASALRRSLVERYPESAPARFALAQQLLLDGDASGVALMESAIAADIAALAPGAQLLRDFYLRQNEVSLAQQWHDKFTQRATLLNAAKRERQTLNVSDRFVPHGLPAETITQLREQLRAMPELTTAYLVRKTTIHLSDAPFYVLAVSCRRRWSAKKPAVAQALVQRVRQEVRFPGAASILNMDGADDLFAAKLRAVKGSRII